MAEKRGEGMSTSAEESGAMSGAMRERHKRGRSGTGSGTGSERAQQRTDTFICDSSEQKGPKALAADVTPGNSFACTTHRERERERERESSA